MMSELPQNHIPCIHNADKIYGNWHIESLESRRSKSQINKMGEIVGSRVVINFTDYFISGTIRTQTTDSAMLRTNGAKTNIYKNSFFHRMTPV